MSTSHTTNIEDGSLSNETIDFTYYAFLVRVYSLI